jgi:hypothetical protein
VIDHTRSKSLAIVSSDNYGDSARLVYMVLPVNPMRIAYQSCRYCITALGIVDSCVITYTKKLNGTAY